jgi:hypothetical protein
VIIEVVVIIEFMLGFSVSDDFVASDISDALDDISNVSGECVVVFIVEVVISSYSAFPSSV